MWGKDTEMYSPWQKATWQEAKQGEVERISVDMICPCIWNQRSGFMAKGIILPRVGRAGGEFHNLLALQYFLLCISKIILKLIEL